MRSESYSEPCTSPGRCELCQTCSCQKCLVTKPTSRPSTAPSTRFSSSSCFGANVFPVMPLASDSQQPRSSSPSVAKLRHKLVAAMRTDARTHIAHCALCYVMPGRGAVRSSHTAPLDSVTSRLMFGAVLCPTLHMHRPGTVMCATHAAGNVNGCPYAHVDVRQV